MHPLDNPIWQSLSTRHARFAQGRGAARRFTPQVSGLAGLREPSPEGFDALAAVVAPGEAVGVFFEERAEPGPDWTVGPEAELLQMTQPEPVRPPTGAAFIELAQADVPEMLALTQLTKPGPFEPRTRELGAYLGVRENGRLAAMAGERLRLPGYVEISAVCTHPEHVGRGYARALVAELAARMHARGERPFLHVLPGNARAIALYESLGFAARRRLHFMLLRREPR